MNGRPARQVHVNALGAVMGGAERHLAPFLTSLHRARPTWDLHVWVYEGVDTTQWPERAVPHLIPWRSQLHRLWWENVDLPRELTARRADVLVGLTNSAPLHSPVPSVLYQRNALWFDRSWLTRLRGRAAAVAVLRRAIICLQARSASVVVAPTRAMAHFLTGWRAWPARREVVVIPHAVDAGRFAFLDHGWPPPGDRPLRLLAVGHDAPHKDQALLVDLVARLRARGHDAELTLTIDADPPTPYVSELLERCRATGVADAVHFVGRTTDVERLYAAADLALTSSVSESFGFPVLEAMAAGVPVVGSAIPATAEVAGGDAWLFAPGDADDAADVVESLLADDPASVRARVRRGADRSATFTWEANADSVATLIDRLLGPSTDPGNDPPHPN